MLAGRIAGLDGLEAKTDAHLDVKTKGDTKVIKLNSRNYAATSGDNIGFQVKPAGNAASGTATIIGGQISPRFLDGKLGANLIGLHVDAYLKGTTGDISADVRALNLELVADEGGARAIGGDVTGIRIRSYLPAGTITGKKQAIKIEVPESGGKAYDAVLALTSTHGAVWDVKGSDYSPSQPRAKIKVLVNGTAYWLVGYAVEPT
ncbi:MAG: hypothetical protein HOO67_06150 [Candidatus Peribacteraceae bacterium]|nr:hypothetical protein [Candidatus Peribacteraceae bacterium]